MKKSPFFVVSAEWLDGQTNEWERSYVISRDVSTDDLLSATQYDDVRRAKKMLDTLVEEGNGRNHLVEKVEIHYTTTPVDLNGQGVAK